MATRGTVCFITVDGKVILAQIEYPDGKLLWNGIGGVAEEDESLHDCVIREVSEETEIILSREDLSLEKTITLGELELSIFIATGWKGQLVAKDSTLKQLKWFDLGNLPFPEMHPGNEDWLPAVLKQYKTK